MIIGITDNELRMIAIALSEHVQALKGDALSEEYLELLDKVDRWRKVPD